MPPQVLAGPPLLMYFVTLSFFIVALKIFTIPSMVSLPLNVPQLQNAPYFLPS